MVLSKKYNRAKLQRIQGITCVGPTVVTQACPLYTISVLQHFLLLDHFIKYTISPSVSTSPDIGLQNPTAIVDWDE